MAIQINIPSVGESISEVILAQWLKQTGDFVEMDEVICELESEKATFELTAETSGVLTLKAEEGDTLEIGSLVCEIEPSEEVQEKVETPTEIPESEKKVKEAKNVQAVTPVAAKVLKDKGIDPLTITGSGEGGKVTKADALKANAINTDNKTTIEAETERHEERKRMSGFRQTIAKHLVNAKNQTAMLTTFNEVDMKPIMELRSKYKERFKERYGVTLGFMSFFTAAACQALKELPIINCQIDGDEIIYHDYCDISIAVSAPKGLVVPVIRDAQNLSFDGIEKAIINLATKAKDNKLTVEEMSGGTFTITNGGIFGSMLSTPIINVPQSAILGMHNIVERAVVINGEIVVRPIMYLALSYDHRIIDGKDSVGFLVRLKELLEDPNRLMLGI